MNIFDKYFLLAICLTLAHSKSVKKPSSIEATTTSSVVDESETTDEPLTLPSDQSTVQEVTVTVTEEVNQSTVRVDKTEPAVSTIHPIGPTDDATSEHPSSAFISSGEPTAEPSATTDADSTINTEPTDEPTTFEEVTSTPPTEEPIETSAEEVATTPSEILVSTEPESSDSTEDAVTTATITDEPKIRIYTTERQVDEADTQTPIRESSQSGDESTDEPTVFALDSNTEPSSNDISIVADNRSGGSMRGAQLSQKSSEQSSKSLIKSFLKKIKSSRRRSSSRPSSSASEEKHHHKSRRHRNHHSRKHRSSNSSNSSIESSIEKLIKKHH